MEEPLIISTGEGGDCSSALWSVGGASTTRATSLASSEGLLGSPTPIDNGPDAAAGGGGPSSKPTKATLNGFVLAVILFFSSAGGPFGVEPSIKAAGNLYAIIGFSVMPFLWSLPEALMTYELSTLYPCASGGVRWVEEAFGEGWGLMVGYLGWISGVTNNASYPVLFLTYVHNQFFPDFQVEDNLALHWAILAVITVVLAYVNYRGLGVVGKVSVLIFFVSMAPFLLMVIIGIPKVDPSKWLQTPTGEDEVWDDDGLDQNGWFPAPIIAGIAFRPFVNNLYWNFNAFDQGSHYSTAVPKKTLRNAITGCFFLVSSAYLLPILITTGATNIQQSEWKAGTFAVAGSEIGGNWLGNWIVVSAGISLLAQFFGEMSAETLQLQGMADRGQLPRIFSHRSRYETPTYALLLGLVVILALLPLQFGIIIELSNFAFCISVSIEFLAFGHLRIRRGDCSKLRKLFYVILLITPMLFNIAIICFASYATYIYSACITVFGVLLINTKRLSSACCSRRGEADAPSLHV